MTTGELPDIFRVNEFSDLAILIDAGVIEDLTDVYNEYASPLLRGTIESEGLDVYNPVSVDGRMYGIPSKMPSTNGYRFLWIRQDWLDKLNLEHPKTMDDLFAIAKAFAENDLGGQDAVGLLFNNQIPGEALGFFWGYHAYPNHWLKGEDGKVVFGSVQPEMKDALKGIKKMYDEGLIEKEFSVKDLWKSLELAVSGQAGMLYGYHWLSFSLVETLKEDPEARWVSVTLPTVDGSPIKIPLTNSVEGAFVVRKGYEHPEALIKMMNLHQEKIFGETADFNTWFGGNDIEQQWNRGPVQLLDPTLDILAHQEIKKAVAEGTTDQLEGTSKGFYNSIQNGMIAIDMMFGASQDAAFAFVDDTYPDQVIWNGYFGPPTPTMVERWSSMEELLVTTFTQMVLGEVDIDSGFDKLVADWNNMGGEQVTKEVNESLSN